MKDNQWALRKGLITRLRINDAAPWPKLLGQLLFGGWFLVPMPIMALIMAYDAPGSYDGSGVLENAIVIVVWGYMGLMLLLIGTALFSKLLGKNKIAADCSLWVVLGPIIFVLSAFVIRLAISLLESLRFSLGVFFRDG